MGMGDIGLSLNKSTEESNWMTILITIINDNIVYFTFISQFLTFLFWQ